MPPNHPPPPPSSPTFSRLIFSPLRTLLLSRLFAYGLLSLSFAVLVVHNAWKERGIGAGGGGFYPAAVAVSRSWVACVTLLNFLVYLAVLLSLLLKTIFFGTLRPLEVEHLYERSWYFFTESMMTLAIFREEFDTRFMLAFGTLYAIKCGHWLSSERVEYMDQMPPPGPSRFYKFRLIAALSFLLTLDGLATSICVQDYNRHRRGGVVLFACEFALLVASVFSVSAKMVVNIVDQRRARGREDAPAWEGKSMWGFYIDVLYNFTKLVIYAFTFYTIFKRYGMLPLNHIHSLYGTVVAFLEKCNALIRYRSATRDMNTKYPDATAEEIASLGGGSCVICREDMIAKEDMTEEMVREMERDGPNSTPKRLYCGHAFHFHCLRSWLERQQSCPTCRQSVLSGAGRPPPATAANHPPPPAPGARPGPTINGVTPTPTHLSTPTPTATAGARSPPGGPVGIWGHSLPTTSSFWRDVRIPSNNTGTIALAAPSSFPITPASTAGTPLASQAPAVFSAFSPSRPGTAAAAAAAAPNATSFFDLQTPGQVAAAAALRRLQGIADGKEANEILYNGHGREHLGSKALQVEQPALPSNRMPYLEALHGGPLPWKTIPLSPPSTQTIISSLMSSLDDLRHVIRGQSRRQEDVSEDLAKLTELDKKLNEVMAEMSGKKASYPA